ncbi:unnamed protein product, partial [Mesorhabditis spiculigera]
MNENSQRLYNYCSLSIALFSAVVTLIGGLIISTAVVPRRSRLELEHGECNLQHLRLSEDWSTLRLFAVYTVLKSDMDYRYSSAFPQLNRADLDHLIFVDTQSSSRINDLDRNTDQMELKFEFPMIENFTATSITYVVFFKYELSTSIGYKADVALTGTVDVKSQHGLWEMSGILKSDQLEPLRDGSAQYIFSPQGQFRVSDLSLPNLLERIHTQPLAIDISRSSTSWRPSEHLEIGLSFSVPSQMLVRATTTFELLKWAWVQYLALFLATRYLTQKALEFLYDSGAIDGVVEYSIQADEPQFSRK